MEFDKNKIVEALRAVMDPQTGVDVIKAKKISDLTIEGKDLNLTLSVSSLKSNEKTALTFSCMAAINELYPSLEVHVHAKVKEEKPTSPLSHIKNTIAVASGKGGVGKSTMSVNLALSLQKKVFSVGLLDLDLYGPSIPTMLGLQGKKPNMTDIHGRPKMIPIEKFGLPTMSIGYVISPEQAVVLRGPRLGGIVKQFISECLWPPLDFLIIDLPPGTGDVHLSLVQTIPLSGVVMVTTPQQVAYDDALKGMNMFRLENVNVPILGVVENMAWFTPDELPSNKYYIFGKGSGKKLAKEANTVLLGQVPIHMSICDDGDQGKPSTWSGQDSIQHIFDSMTNRLIQQVQIRNEMIAPTQMVDVQK